MTAATASTTSRRRRTVATGPAHGRHRQRRRLDGHRAAGRGRRADLPDLPCARARCIDTPTGPVAVEDLRLGDPIWTLDADGRRVAGTVIALGSTTAPADHHVIRLDPRRRAVRHRIAGPSARRRPAPSARSRSATSSMAARSRTWCRCRIRAGRRSTSSRPDRPATTSLTASRWGARRCAPAGSSTDGGAARRRHASPGRRSTPGTVRDRKSMTTPSWRMRSSMANDEWPVPNRYSSCGWSRAFSRSTYLRIWRQRAAAVVLAGGDQERRRDPVHVLDRRALLHQLRHVGRRAAEQRAVVRLEERRLVGVGRR